ncbi:MAG: hypothetical protein GXO48_02840 [Chlorobi bacterium]|nr:hypothetical protein [Chlorobiota bacterium]
MNRTLKSNKKEFVRGFLHNHAQRLIDHGYDLGYKKLANMITKHFRNMNLEFVDVVLPEEEGTLLDNFIISHSPHTWSLRSPYNHHINCEFSINYVEKLISFYDEFSKKVKHSRTIKIEPFEDINPDNTPLTIAYEIFSHGSNTFIPRISLYLETFFMNIWIHAEQDSPDYAIPTEPNPYLELFRIFELEDSDDEPKHPADITTIKITFKTKKFGYRRGKSYRGKHKKNIDRTLSKNFSAPTDLSELTEISLDSWEFERGKEGELVLYYRIPSDKIWHLSINNILGLIDLTLKK